MIPQPNKNALARLAKRHDRRAQIDEWIIGLGIAIEQKAQKMNVPQKRVKRNLC